MVRIKICGITRPGDAELAATAGADAIGLVFYPPSPRHVQDLENAREIALAVGPFVNVVGLFVNPEPDFLEQVLARVPLSVLQFHGDESESFCQSFERPFLKAVRMKPDMDVHEQLAGYSSASGILLDAYKKGVPGGTGETFDWARVPLNPSRPIVLAGGLSPENVASAVRIVEPYGVDVSGGVESAPGIKDRDKIKAFIRNAKLECASE